MVWFLSTFFLQISDQLSNHALMKSSFVWRQGVCENAKRLKQKSESWFQQKWSPQVSSKKVRKSGKVVK